VKIVPDNDICGAHGACAMVDEELFNLDDDGFISIGDGVVVPAERKRSRIVASTHARCGRSVSNNQPSSPPRSAQTVCRAC
jgi:ferredoxin